MFALGIKPLAPKPRGMVQIPPIHTPGQEDFALWLVERVVLCTRLRGRGGANAEYRIGQSHLPLPDFSFLTCKMGITSSKMGVTSSEMIKASGTTQVT